MREVLRRLRKAADSAVTVLILGESGTGKDLVARALHAASVRAARPLVAVNPAALSPSVLESELFGHEKGAFTGAHETRVGLIEAADQGTLFLDEIGDMPLPVQVKLLRVIENMEILRVGASVPTRVDVRIIAATHKNLEALVREGKFREDLYFRLSGAVIELPPLRERLEDLEVLVHEFLADSSEATRKQVREVSPEVTELFRHYAWPGNVRELRKFVEAMVMEDEDGYLDLCDLPPHIARVLERAGARADADGVLPCEKKKRVLALLDRYRWNMSRTSRELGVHRSTLYAWLREWGVERNVSDPS
jgi:transcriptional regulator with PAS, ATPase and Fis domain